MKDLTFWKIRHILHDFVNPDRLFFRSLLYFSVSWILCFFVLLSFSLNMCLGFLVIFGLFIFYLITMWNGILENFFNKIDLSLSITLKLVLFWVISGIFFAIMEAFGVFKSPCNLFIILFFTVLSLFIIISRKNLVKNWFDNHISISENINIFEREELICTTRLFHSKVSSDLYGHMNSNDHHIRTAAELICKHEWYNINYLYEAINAFNELYRAAAFGLDKQESLFPSKIKVLIKRDIAFCLGILLNSEGELFYSSTDNYGRYRAHREYYTNLLPF